MNLQGEPAPRDRGRGPPGDGNYVYIILYDCLYSCSMFAYVCDYSFICLYIGLAAQVQAQSSSAGVGVAVFGAATAAAALLRQPAAKAHYYYES